MTFNTIGLLASPEITSKYRVRWGKTGSRVRWAVKAKLKEAFIFYRPSYPVTGVW